MAGWSLVLLLVGRLAADPGEDFSPELRAGCQGATVRLVNETTRACGSGVIVKQGDRGVYLLTAQHLVDGGKTFQIYTFTAESSSRLARIYQSAQVVAELKEYDLAVVLLPTTDRMPAVARLCPVRLVPDAKNFPGLTTGLNEETPTCLLVTVAGKKRVRRPEEQVARAAWELTPEQPRGRSGGPLFDRRGYVLGILSGSSEGKSYGCDTEAIYHLLKVARLEALFEEEKDQSKGPER